MTETFPARWTRDDGELPPRAVLPSLFRGLRSRCPSCGQRTLFRAFLKVSDACPACSEELHHHRADDAPPYFTIMVVGHIVVPAMLIVERTYHPDMWIHTAIWPALAVILSLVTLPAIKGALVGYQWALYMHGFDPRSGGDESWDGVGFEAGRGRP